MTLELRLKRMLVRTPLEGPAKLLRAALQLPSRWRHPELRELHAESGRIDRALAREIGPDWNCIDVGCHIGSTLSQLLRLAPQGRHWAFEPIPEKARWLRRRFPEVTVCEVALSSESGQAVFHENLTRSGFSSLSRPTRAQDRTLEHRVRTERLDAVIPEEQRIDYLKIDVEGGELPVLQGAVATLRRERPLLLFECSPLGPQRFGFEPRDVFEFVTGELGYSVRTPRTFLEGGEALSADEFLAALEYPFTAFNFFGTPRSARPGASPRT